MVCVSTYSLVGEYALDMHHIFSQHIHWVTRGTGTPKDRDEVNRRDVSECDW